jgi:hypothetical protein
MCNALSTRKVLIRDQPMAVVCVHVAIQLYSSTQLTLRRSHYFPTVSLLSLGSMYSHSKTYESDFFLIF